MQNNYIFTQTKKSVNTKLQGLFKQMPPLKAITYYNKPINIKK